MAYSVQLRPAPLRDLKALPPEVVERVSRKISHLAHTPRPQGVEKLSRCGDDFYRIRVGDYRILYTTQDDPPLVVIARVRHRREAYR